MCERDNIITLEPQDDPERWVTMMISGSQIRNWRLGEVKQFNQHHLTWDHFHNFSFIILNSSFIFRAQITCDQWYY